jgi:hypothetical protein
MGHGIRESDWKLFRELRAVALDRFCHRTLVELGRLANDGTKSHHERYLMVFELLRRRDRELADVFDNPRRSTALLQLALIQSRALLSEEEFARFSAETRELVGDSPGFDRPEAR